MASTLFETLDNIEKGRKNCIKNAKLAKLLATDNMSIYDIGNLFLQQNNTEFIDPDDPENGGGWHRPDDWWDCEEILRNAEVRDGLYPAYIMLLADWDRETILGKNTSTNNALQGDGYLTSDGAWYKESSTTHIWDVTKDKECSEGYKTRYVIVYLADTQNIGVMTFVDFPCLEVIFGNIKIEKSRLSFFNNKYIRSIICLENTNYIEVESSSIFANCSSLEHISLPSLTTISGGSIFSNCSSLKHISLPSLTTLKSGSTFANCSSLKHISLPSLTTINGSNTFYYCYNLKSVSLPELISINDGGTFYNCYALKDISLPALTTIKNGNTFYYCYNLEYISLPSLTTISGGSIFYNCYALKDISLLSLTTIKSSTTFAGCKNLKNASFPVLKIIEGFSTFSGCLNLESILSPSLAILNGRLMFEECNLKEYTFLSTIEQITDITNIFKKCYSLSRVKLYNDWDISGLSVSDSKLTRSSLIDMLEKLKDVSLEEKTYTITLGNENLSRLTEEEIVVGTAKGWVIN